jgi:pyruvate dehydrogenase kinase 2/3/4
MSLSSRHLPPEELDAFMRRMLVSRISRRVLAEHHIALSDSLAGQRRSGEGDEDAHVGLIYTALNVRGCVENCVRWLREKPLDVSEDEISQWPEFIIDGHLGARFSYIREHLE